MSNTGAEANLTEEAFLLASIHDIRHHVRNSMMHAQLLERESGAELTTNAMAHLTGIIAANRDLDGLLKRLVQYSRAGSEAKDKPLGSLHTMFYSAVRLLVNRTAGAEISYDAAPEHTIEAPLAVEIVLRELLDNALKFRKGPVKISLIVEERADTDVVGIRDTGIGIEPQYSEKIMLPFERLHPASVYPGSGLGLAICQRTVSAWGGKLWVQSPPAGGSTFWFDLPA